MSINNIANTVFPNTLSGLDSINVTDITINGVDVTTLFVPYTGANANVDLNNKNLSSVNNVGTTTVVATGAIQGGALTTTGVTTTNTLKVNSVPAGTTSKYLATDSTGNVIEANITTTYIPYTNATANVNLNAKNLSNVLTYSGTNLQVTSTETTSLLATGLAQLGTLRISSVPAGTQTNLLAVNATGDVIIGTAPPSSQLNLSPTTSPTLYYFPFIASSNAGTQTVYTDNAVITLTYDTATKTLSPYRLKIQNVPAGTQTSLLAIDSAGNVIQGTSTTTQLLTTRTATSSTYYPTFVTSNSTGDKSYFVPYPSTAGYNITYTTGAGVGDVGTLNIPQLVIDISCVLSATGTSFDGVPTAGSVVYGLGIDSSNRIRSYNAGSPNITVTNTNASFYPVFVNSAISSGVKDLYQDTVGNDFAYNPSTNLLTVSNLTVSGTTTISGYAPIASPAFTGTPTAPTAISGTNTTQIATTAFVTTAVAGVTGYLPLTGGTMTGSITYANTALTPITLSSANLTAYTYSIRDSFWTLPMLEFTTKTLSTFGSVSFGVPIVITNTSSTNLISLPYNASTAYSKSISNTGGDLFITFTGSTTSPAANGTVIFGSSIPVLINDTLSMNPASTGILCNTYKNISNATLQIQGFWSGANSGIRFDANSTNNASAPALYANINSGGTTFYNGNTTQQERLTITNDRVKVSYVELAVSSTTAGQIRMIWSETGYGAFFRNDNGNLYILLTANNDPYGGWNGLRPFYINLASGMLYSNDGQTFSGGTDTTRITFQNGLGLTTAAGATYGNVSLYGTGINGWTGYDLGKRWTLMYSGNECGFHDNQSTWQWRVISNSYYLTCPTIVFQNTPQQSYQPYQVLIGSNNNSLQWGVIYSSYYYNPSIQWQYGALVASFSKASATSILRISGAASYYVPTTGGMRQTQILWYNTTTGGQWNVYQLQFTNNPNNHVSFPIMAQYAGLPTGNYEVYMYTNGQTDGNDHLYILAEICFA